MKPSYFPLALLSFVLTFSALAQPSFIEVTPAANPVFTTPDEEDFWVAAVAAADADGDGDVDLAVLGTHVVYDVSATDRLVLLLNQGVGGGGSWSFTTVELPLGDITAGGSDLAWGDFDADGDHDLALGSEGVTVIYANSGGTLAPLSTSPLPGYWEDSEYDGAYDLRSLSWADFDNDGDLDLLIPTVWDADLLEFSTHLMRNDGPDGAGGWIFTDQNAGLAPTRHAQSAWADDDGDGDLDLLLVNVDPYLETGFIRRYSNDAGIFTATDLVDLRVAYGLADWGDAEGDGDLDLLVAGNVQEEDGNYNTVLRVYRRSGTGFTAETLLEAPDANWLDIHAATWADYDSDGDVDILVTGNFIGESKIEGHSQIFANQGGSFSALPVELPAPYGTVGSGGSFSWFDLDQDGDLDYLVAGAYFVPGGNGLVEAQMHLYRNGATATNAAPTTPSGLGATTTGANAVTLQWNSASDDHTTVAALTYDLELRRNGVPFGTARRLPEPGNVSTATSWDLAGLPPGSYTWSVRAVDAAFRGGTRAQGSFVIGADIFRDGFESGGASAWSVVVGAALSSSRPAAAPAASASGSLPPERTLPPPSPPPRRSSWDRAAGTPKE